MGNPRQRRKARSGSHRAISHSKHAQRNLKKTRPIRGPKVLQDAWDNRKTVRQNYAALGLIHDLNPSASGGAEPIEDTAVLDLPSPRSPPATDTSINGAQASTLSSTILPKGKGRIIRDEAGNILRVQLAEEDQGDSRQAPDGDLDMEMLEPDLDESAIDKWVTDLGYSQTRRPIGKDGDVVQALERISVPTDGTGHTISASLTGVGARFSAHGEVGYLRRLVDKYGHDIEKMARDRKLNPEQRTAGELRRALKRAGIV
ncbi:hypothetical protein BDZ89DRAFT_978328 [Hymenopellis radicata]|nr:hypothetical protein BDZ89DRAFT_978328 [Hymenopellis radicata]